MNIKQKDGTGTNQEPRHYQLLQKMNFMVKTVVRENLCNNKNEHIGEAIRGQIARTNHRLIK